MYWCLLIIELKNAQLNIEISRYKIDYFLVSLLNAAVSTAQAVASKGFVELLCIDDARR